MRLPQTARRTTCLVVVVCFLTAGCAGTMQNPGQAAMVCGAGGAAAGAAIGAAAARNWQGALIGAAAGALVGAGTCFAIAEYRSRQVQGYQQTQQAINYHPSQGETVQITRYELMPAAVAPGGQVAFNATYYVMTPNPDQDIPITEVRIVNVYDPSLNQYRELGRVPSQVTVKPGTRQSDGKIPVGSGVAEGQYQFIFQVSKNGLTDTQVLPMTVTRNQAILGSPSNQNVVAWGAKRIEPPASAAQPSPSPVQPSQPAQPKAIPPTQDVPLAALGEPQPRASALPDAAARPAAPVRPESEGQKVTYFMASKVVGKGLLREGPGAGYRIVGEVQKGDRFVILAKRTNPGEDRPWYKLRLDTGAEAWVFGGLGEEVQE